MTEETKPEVERPLSFSSAQAYEARLARGRNVRYDSRYYASDMFSRPEMIVNDYLEKLHELPEHDTLIGTGISGSVVAGILAVVTGKMYAVVRKRGVDAHSDRPVEGLVGERWIFVDDFIASGTTQMRVIKTMADETCSEFVGSWLFRSPHFQPPTQARGYEPPRPKIEPVRETVFDLAKLPQDSLTDPSSLVSTEVTVRVPSVDITESLLSILREQSDAANKILSERYKNYR